LGCNGEDIERGVWWILIKCYQHIPEGVVDGKIALLAPENDMETLAKHLEYLVEHPDVWGTMGRAGREHVEQEYDLMVQVGKLEEIYDGLCEVNLNG